MISATSVRQTPRLTNGRLFRFHEILYLSPTAVRQMAELSGLRIRDCGHTTGCWVCQPWAHRCPRRTSQVSYIQHLAGDPQFQV